MTHDEMKIEAELHCMNKITELLEEKIERFSLPAFVSFETCVNVLKKWFGYYMHDDDHIETNGWDVDFWMKLRCTGRSSINVSGSVFTGHIQLTLVDENED